MVLVVGVVVASARCPCGRGLCMLPLCWSIDIYCRAFGAGFSPSEMPGCPTIGVEAQALFHTLGALLLQTYY